MYMYYENVKTIEASKVENNTTPIVNRIRDKEINRIASVISKTLRLPSMTDECFLNRTEYYNVSTMIVDTTYRFNE